MNVYGPLNENDRDRRVITVRKIYDDHPNGKKMTSISDYNKTEGSNFHKY